MKLTPVAFNPFDNPARRVARAAGGGVQTTAPFPEKPEGYEFYGPTDNPTGGTPGFGAAELPSYEAAPQDAGNPSVLGKIGAGLIEGLHHWTTTPGETMKGPEQVQPEVPGQWSEEDQYRQNLAQAAHTQRQTDFGGETALNLFGTSAPFVPKGSIGVAGGRPPVAEMPVAQPFYSAVERAIAQLPEPVMTGEQWWNRLWTPESTKKVAVRDANNRPTGEFKEVTVQGASPLAGVKPEELEYLGLDDWLKEQKGPVTKQQVLDHVRDNQVQLQEVMKGENPAVQAEINKLDREVEGLYGDMQTYRDDADTGRQIQGSIDSRLQRIAELRTQRDTGTKFSSYTLPGGENYREMLLTMPNRGAEDVAGLLEKNLERQREISAAVRNNDSLTEVNKLTKEWRNLQREEGELRQRGEGSQFKSSHWDEPNVLAHVRFNDRVIDGKKTLFVEEIQSDWHQKGKREGYREPKPFKEIQPDEVQIERVTPQEAQNDIDYLGSHLKEWRTDNNVPMDVPLIRYRLKGDQTGWSYHFDPKTTDADILKDLRADRDPYTYAGARNTRELEAARGDKGVPQAPFKTTWPELAMKRIIRYAAENGYDKVAWTPGDVQAARYDLSKHVDRVAYNPENHHLLADKNGQNLIDEKSVPPEKLADYIGKDAAEKLLNSPKHVGSPRIGTYHELTGLDLKVGGEGMKGFYDQILPAAVNKLVKKHGARVDRGSVEIAERNKGPFTLEGNGPWVIRNREGEFVADFNNRQKAEQTLEVLKKPRTQSAHTLDITPSLRKSVMEHGFPQFARGGSVKASKESVKYSRGMPHSRCGICEFYSNHACTKVKGSIDPQMWCSLFKKKQSRASGGRVGYEDGGSPMRTAGFPEQPEGYEFFGPTDAPDVKGFEPPEMLKKAAEPFTSYPETYADINREARETMSRGVEQLMNPIPGGGPEAKWQALKGVGNVGMGALDYTLSPITAGIRTFAGKPLEEATGIPKEQSEFVANMMVPGLGITRIPKVVKGAEKLANIDKVHNLSGVPRADAEAVMQANADRGLSFPVEEASDRLRLKIEREKKLVPGKEPPGEPHERSVVRAPEGSGLPDFVTGKITPEDWVARHENILSKDEISEAAKWYDKIFDEFLTQTKGDVPKAKKYMRGWLVAQQNVDVSGAMGNVLLQAEQIKRGMPVEKMRAAGMPNPTQAARSVMQDQPLKGGVGQKISDFVDAAEGKDVRSWMANHPSGGSPFVVDVHTARDTGIVDQELINHLKRLGYNEEDLSKLKTNLDTSPSQAQYENRADFGRKLTKHLNDINWQGRSDWKPKEVQAVGWMGMTKLTANKAEDVVSGLSQNMRHLSMELSPGEGSPWHTKYGERFGSLAPEDQYALTHSVTQQAIDHASKIAGIDVRDIVHGTGGWQSFQNPSTIAQSFATKEGAEIAANVLGHILQQTEVWSNKVKPLTSSPKGFAVDFIASGEHNLNTDAGLRDFWAKVMDADPLKGTKKPLFEGYQPIVTRDGRVGIRALIDRGGVKTQESIEGAIHGPVDKMLQSLPFDVETRFLEAEITKARNDWKASKNGQGYTQRLGDLIGRDISADLNSAGKKLEAEFRKGIEAAEAKRKAPAKKVGGSVSRGPRLVPVSHNPFESGNAIRRAIHGY